MVGRLETQLGEIEVTGDVVERYVKMLAAHRVALCFGQERK